MHLLSPLLSLAYMASSFDCVIGASPDASRCELGAAIACFFFWYVYPVEDHKI